MGQFLNQIRKKLGLEPKRDKTLTGKIPNEIVVNRVAQNEQFDKSNPETPFVLAPARMATPTHSGHGVLVKAAQDTAKKFNAPYNVVLTRTHKPATSRTQGAKVRDPLHPEHKLMWARKFFPGANINLAPHDQPNLLSQASDLHRKGINHLIVVAGSDRVPEYEKLLNNYNGKEGGHGYFNFKKISVVPAGEERDPNAVGSAGWSGTRVRKAIEQGNLEDVRKNAFPPHLGDKDFQQYVQHLKSGMGLDQSMSEENNIAEFHGYPVLAIPTRDARDYRGKSSPLNKLPPPGDKGNLGKDSHVDDGKEKTNFELMRRRNQKRQQHARFLEGYDDFDTVTDSPRPAAPAPVTTPVPSRPLTKKKDLQKEGLFAADVNPGAGNPNNPMIQLNPDLRAGPMVTAKETKVKKFKSVREACWTGYEPVGVKKKNGKTVPNCVPKEETQLDELDPKTLQSYLDKTSDVAKSNYHWKGGFIVNKIPSHKAKNRKQGRLRALDRIMQREDADAVAKFLEKGGQVKKYSSTGEPMNEATYKGKKVPLNKPMEGDVKKSKVYVKKPNGKVVKVNFGDKNLSIKKNIPARKKSYCARSSGQGNLTNKTSANYWSRRAWNCEEIQFDDETTPKGSLKHGTRVQINKDGYVGKGNVDFFDPSSGKYLVSIDKNGSNLYVDAHDIKPINEEKKFPAVRKDPKSGLPVKYRQGLSDATAKARAAHWKAKSKLSDSDPKAYEPAPGDATAKTKPSKYTKAYHAKFGESVDSDQQIDEAAGLADKAKKSGVSIGTLRKVYRRGVAAWNSGHRPGTTPQQWGMARVNSYITKGKTYHTADKDLREESLVERVTSIIEREKTGDNS